METQFFTVETNNTLMTELVQQLDQASPEDLTVSVPVQKDSLADPLDSPIGADEIQSIIELATVIIKSGTGLLGFVSALKTLFGKKKEKEYVVIRDSKSGKIIGRVDSSMSDEEIKKLLGL